MNCYICSVVICEHGRKRYYGNGKIECLDCGLIVYDLEPITFSLPFYEGKYEPWSKVCFPVCRGCFLEKTLVVPSRQINIGE